MTTTSFATRGVNHSPQLRSDPFLLLIFVFSFLSFEGQVQLLKTNRLVFAGNRFVFAGPAVSPLTTQLVLDVFFFT
jgi:hypothetical protein